MKWILLLIFIISCGQSEEGALISDGVQPYEHRIFVTQATLNADFGALINADHFCQNEARQASLVRNYKAIISNASEDAKERLNIYGSVYNVDSSGNAIKIVSTPADLWRAFSFSFLSPVEFSANGNVVSGRAWTGSSSEGSRSQNHCSNWSTTSASSKGQAGLTGSMRGDWLEDGLGDDCSEAFHLYCISQ